MQVAFSARATRQLADVDFYISEMAGDAVAEGYISRILRFCRRLDMFPVRGTSHDDLLPGLRVVGFERRVTIAFIVTNETVLIEGIFYGGQDWASALKTP